MALTATMFHFAIELADVDRGVYESIAVRVAQHPSETNEHMIARVLAYALEYTEGIAFSEGIANPDEPAIAVRDLTGALRAWIDIGVPDAARLHRASKAAPRVAVYTHRDPRTLVKALAGERIHRADQLALYAIDRELIDGLVERLARRMSFALSVTDRHLFIAIDGASVSGEVRPVSLAEP